MDHRDIISILEILLLLVVFFFLYRFVFTNYASRIRKPAAWKMAVKNSKVPDALLKAERKYPDRIRFYNIWLQLERIKKLGVKGDLAELGVYKGETARVIHLCAPDRKLHLFDTFEGFPALDLQSETGKASGYTSRHFADTSPARVKALFDNRENILTHEGYFPQSASAVADLDFAFVSMDADLYKPTRSGLEFFYPRLSPGGIILIHDYNDDWPGLIKAVDEFCAGIPESPVPVPDADSTVMIIRSQS